MRRSRWAVPQVASLVAVVLALASGTAVATAGLPPAPAPVVSPASPPLQEPVPSSAPTAAPAAAATRLLIPSIGVDTALVPIDTDGAGVLIPPPTTDVAGWFVRGAAPAQPGPAIVAGHIDSYEGPGVFFRLHEVAVGAVVEVDTSRGPPVHYQVVSITTVPKTEFPTDAVYGPTPAPELRMITCGGEFDRTDRRYLRNVIVAAVLV